MKNRLRLVVSALFAALALVCVHAKMPDLTPLPGTGQLAPPSDPDKFTFLVAGDNRPAHSGDPQPPIPGKILAAAKAAKVSFVLWTGDTISGKNPSDGSRIQQQYQEFLGIAAAAGVPVYNAPGNHELDDSQDVPNSQMLAWYVQYMGPAYGAVNIGNSRFIALNSEQMPGSGGGGSGDKEPGYIDDAQRGLLEADLKANQQMAHIFIFMHHPLKPYKTKDGFVKQNGDKLLKLLAKYPNVSFVFSGHEHMYFNPQSNDGLGQPGSRKDPSSPPTYIVTGGAGAPLMKNAPGGFYNYVVVTVEKDKVSGEMVKVDSDGGPTRAKATR